MTFWGVFTCGGFRWARSDPAACRSSKYLRKVPRVSRVTTRGLRPVNSSSSRYGTFRRFNDSWTRSPIDDASASSLISI